MDILIIVIEVVSLLDKYDWRLIRHRSFMALLSISKALNQNRSKYLILIWQNTHEDNLKLFEYFLPEFIDV